MSRSGYQRLKMSANSLFSARTWVCSSRCAPSLDHCICCFLQNRLLIKGSRQPRVKMHAKTEPTLFQEDTDNFPKFSTPSSSAVSLPPALASCSVDLLYAPPLRHVTSCCINRFQTASHID